MHLSSCLKCNCVLHLHCIRRAENIERHIYICGDININLLTINENNNYNTFYESVTSNGFMPQLLPSCLPMLLLSTQLPQLLCPHTYPIHVTRSLIRLFTNNHKNFILARIISDHQMTCCILHNHNAVKRENREYIEIENINEKKTLGQL